MNIPHIKERMTGIHMTQCATHRDEPCDCGAVPAFVRPDCPSCSGTNKACSMNCGPAIGDTRSSADIARNCEECFVGCSACLHAATDVSNMLAHSDAARFKWALPILTGADEHLACERFAELAGALARGFIGRDAVDHAMKASRTKEPT